ncbi:LysE family translocator [Gracilibacillus sp. HCP3S3_G5_1]|uniref:LysE family translocator n=1 Tax=unclassified Gracilibacillus TaxID=2625209 RepID=UPI003F887B63
MVSLFFTYVLLGLSIALPVGAVTIEMTKQGLKNGFMHGWFVGLGGMTVDFILIILLYFGFAPFLSLPIVQSGMWIIGSLFLVYIGIDSITNAEKDINLGEGKIKKSLKSSYLNGFLVAISPGGLVFWLGIFGTVLADSFNTTGISGFSIVAAGILVGILIHDIILMSIVAKARVLLNNTIIKWISIIAGLLLFSFAIYFAYEFYKSIYNL